MNKIKWLLKQLLPLTYWTTYTEEDVKYFEIWKMWFGRCYDKTRFQIAKGIE